MGIGSLFCFHGHAFLFILFILFIPMYTEILSWVPNLTLLCPLFCLFFCCIFVQGDEIRASVCCLSCVFVFANHSPGQTAHTACVTAEAGLAYLTLATAY